MTTLVMGLPGAGKTTYVRRHLGDGLCYDFDYLSAALRLCELKSESQHAAIGMANWLLDAFCEAAPFHAQDVFVIRTAPTAPELRRIRPDRAVIVKHRGARRSPNAEALIRRIVDAEEMLRASGCPVKVVEW